MLSYKNPHILNFLNLFIFLGKKKANSVIVKSLVLFCFSAFASEIAGIFKQCDPKLSSC